MFWIIIMIDFIRRHSIQSMNKDPNDCCEKYKVFHFIVTCSVLYFFIVIITLPSNNNDH